MSNKDCSVNTEVFESFLRSEVIPHVEKMRHYYLSHVKRGRSFAYQWGKVFEEYGEVVQAMMEERFWSKNRPVLYPQARGTFQSECADLVLALCLAHVVSASRRDIAVRDTSLRCLDEASFRNLLLYAVSDARTRDILFILWLYFYENGDDLIRHIKSRMKFNEEEKAKARAIKIKETVARRNRAITGGSKRANRT